MLGTYAMIYLANCFDFVSVATTFDTTYIICGKFISGSTLYSVNVLIVLIP